MNLSGIKRGLYIDRTKSERGKKRERDVRKWRFKVSILSQERRVSW